MIKIKSLLGESFDESHEAQRRDWLERHNATFDDKGRLIAYHGTTPAKAKVIQQTGFRKGSYFTLRKEYAKHWGKTVLQVRLPLNAVDFVMSDIFALRDIKWDEVISGVNETREEDFLNHHYTGHISSHHYEDSEDPNKSHFAKYKKSKYPHLNSTEQHGSYTVEYRQSGEKNEYVKDDDNGDIIRKPNGDVVFMTDAEIRAKNLPTHDETIVAFIGEQCVGLVSNEFGAVGVWVLKPFQKLGIGTSLLEKHVELRPRLKTGKGKFGQMTNAGVNLTVAYYRKMAKKHGKDWFEKLKQSKLTEAKLNFKPDPSISKEDADTAYQLLHQYFKQRNSLHWLYSQEWHLKRVKTGYSYIDGDRYSFDYYPKDGTETQLQPYRDAAYTKKYKVFRTPKEVIDYITIKDKEFGDDIVFRGMNMAEFVHAKKQGFIKSKGEYNLGNIPHTYFGDKWSVGHSYASGFAPFDKIPTRKMPGVIIAVPKSLTKNARELGHATDNEFVAEQIPFKDILGVWIVTPIRASDGFFELVNRQGKLSDGSRSGQSIQYVVVPEMGIALKESMQLSEGVILIHPKDKQSMRKYLNDMDADVKGFISQNDGVIEAEELVKMMNTISDNLPSNTFPFKVKYVFTAGSGKKGQFDKDSNTVTLSVAYNCVWHVGTRIGDNTIQHIYNVYSVNFKGISSTLFHEFTHYIQNEYRMAKSGHYEIPDNWSEGDKYFKHGWERQAHAIGYLEKLKQELNIRRPESILRQLKKMGVLHNNDLNKLKQSDFKSWKAIMKQAIMATIADIEDRKNAKP